MSDLFFASAQRDADEVHDFRNVAAPAPVTMVITNPETKAPIAWVVPNVISEKECGELIELGEKHGLIESSYKTLRTSKRTKNYQNKELAERIVTRISPEALQVLRDTSETGGTPDVWGIHPNWRMVRYDTGDSFPAHYDQADSIQLLKTDGKKDLVFSSHTMLIMLSDGFEGGATRFYPRNDYSYLVDVQLPKRWALIFKQRKCLHSGREVRSGSKYIAQCGILRRLGDKERFAIV